MAERVITISDWLMHSTSESVECISQSNAVMRRGCFYIMRFVIDRLGLTEYSTYYIPRLQYQSCFGKYKYTTIYEVLACLNELLLCEGLERYY